jgi:hypothetical protein
MIEFLKIIHFEKLIFRKEINCNLELNLIGIEKIFFFSIKFG